MAIDTFLETGQRKEAINNIIKLSDFESKIDPNKALKSLDYAIQIMKSDKLLDKEISASLLHRKAELLFDLRDYPQSLMAIQEACSLRRELIGNEIERHASLSLAIIITETLNDENKKHTFQNELNEVSKLIKDDNFFIRQKLSDYIRDKKNIPQEFIDELVVQKDKVSLCAIYMFEYMLDDIEAIDKALILATELENDKLLSDIYLEIAEKKYKDKDILEAFFSYKKSLEYNPFNYASYQNCTKMLFDNELFKEAEEFLKVLINTIGELPNVCYFYAKSLFENQNYELALEYFKKANSSEETNEYILKCVNNINDVSVIRTTNKQIPNIPFISKDMLSKALQDFSLSISQDSRMSFWKLDKETKKHNWISSPEEYAKQLLISFLNGKFGKDTIEILSETQTGAGYIDLYIRLQGGLKTIIELKMCGNGYSSTYALSGESQIVHYAKNKNTHIGFLVVFDARTRDQGKHFIDLKTIDNVLIHTLVVDVRSKIEKF